jgi:hypothetical protein
MTAKRITVEVEPKKPLLVCRGMDSRDEIRPVESQEDAKVSQWAASIGVAPSHPLKKIVRGIKDWMTVKAGGESAKKIIMLCAFAKHLESVGLAGPIANSSFSACSLLATIVQQLGLYGAHVDPGDISTIVGEFSAPELVDAWIDPFSPGWVYQYWNDPEREALDAKINAGGKIEAHEIASKTQVFTERYMVEWLLHNSLGFMWLCICKKNGWKADAEAVLPALDARRSDWRKKREAKEVALDALMPIEGELEDHWKYYIPQPIPDDAVAQAHESIRSLKLMDPAVGSGNFLICAFELLVPLYREEARHKGESVSDREIAESILENNVHGVDIDPFCCRLSATVLLIMARRLSSDARPKRINIAAPPDLGNIAVDNATLRELKTSLLDGLGIPESRTHAFIAELAKAKTLGTLYKLNAAIDALLCP